ncbi:hypothetical protein EVA_07754 [gut metagenome]|uniref:Uncharacterized protein n=1 Tax=gut metagenome TaxID=749906 RepID=J9GP55_9ZZZZ
MRYHLFDTYCWIKAEEKGIQNWNKYIEFLLSRSTEEYRYANECKT